MDKDPDCRFCLAARNIWAWLLAGFVVLLLAWWLRDVLPALLLLYLLLLALLGLLASARVARAVIGKLCRKWAGDPKGSGSENHPPARGLSLPPHTYKRPDPRLYSQAWLMARGLAVTWDNPDISLLDGAAPASPHALLPAHDYVIQARIWNGSPEAVAVNMRVRFAVLAFGIGTVRTELGEVLVDLPVKGAAALPVIASMPWKTPPTPGHYCVQVQLLWDDDANSGNNLGQTNLDVKQLNSPNAKFTFTLRNDSAEARALELRTDAYRIPPLPPCSVRVAEFPRGRPTGDRDPFAAHRPTVHRLPEGWRVAMDHDPATVLRPGEAREVTVDVTAPDGFAGSLDLNVNAIARTADGEVLVGGVTLRATARERRDGSAIHVLRRASAIHPGRRYAGKGAAGRRRRRRHRGGAGQPGPHPGLDRPRCAGTALHAGLDAERQAGVPAPRSCRHRLRVQQRHQHRLRHWPGGRYRGGGRGQESNRGCRQRPGDEPRAVPVQHLPLRRRPAAGPGSREVNLALATAAGKAQGDLLRRPKPPLKNAKGSDLPYVGYFRTVVFSQAWGTWKAWTEVVGRDYGWFGIIGPDQQQEWGKYQKLYSHERPKLASVPVLHCEFEGSRIRDTLAAIEFFSFGGSWCKRNWFFRALCTILQTIFAPLALLAALAAWAAASDGKIGDALEGGGTVGPKDDVIVRGRWAYDGGHEGWNEMHATRIVQKVENVPADPGLFDDFLKRWCTLLSDVPHADPSGTRPKDANAAATYDAQARPENSWVLHPAIDGCAPSAEPTPGGGLH